MSFQRGDIVRYVGRADMYRGLKGIVQESHLNEAVVHWGGQSLRSSHLHCALSLVERALSCQAPAAPPSPPGPKGDKGNPGATVDDVVALAEQHLAEAKQIQKEERKRQAEAKKQGERLLAEQRARQALADRIAADKELACATINLLHEIDRRFQGGEERTADAYISRNIDQLQPLARSYGYKIVKPGTNLAVVVKL